MSSEIDDTLSVEDLRKKFLMSNGDLEQLLHVSDEYLKFCSSSKRGKWLMCVNAYFELIISGKKVKIKVSTYHDIKEVKWDQAEKTSFESRTLLVMGKKAKEENWKEGSYRLKYWMIFEIQPYGEYTCPVQPAGWKDPFKFCNGGFEYQHIEKKERK